MVIRLLDSSWVQFPAYQVVKEGHDFCRPRMTTAVARGQERRRPKCTQKFRSAQTSPYSKRVNRPVGTLGHITRQAWCGKDLHFMRPLAGAFATLTRQQEHGL